jgi:hypothetical protein
VIETVRFEVKEGLGSNKISSEASLRKTGPVHKKYKIQHKSKINNEFVQSN